MLDGVRGRAERLRTDLERRGTAALEASPAPVRTAYRLADRTVRDTLEDRVPGLAAEVALFTLISLPSLILVVLGSLGYLADALGDEGRAELDRIVYDLPATFFSDSTYDAYADLADRVIADGRADVIGLGLVLGLWTGSRATARTLEVVSIAYDQQLRPSWKRRLLAFGLTAGGLAGALAVLPMLVLGPRLVELVAPDTVATATLDLLSLLYWPTLVLAGLATLYHVGVPWRTPWLRDLPGAVLAMAVWLLASAGLRAYLAVSGQDDEVYRQLSTPIAGGLWLYVSAIALLLGAELNAEIEKMWPARRREREQESEQALREG